MTDLETTPKAPPIELFFDFASTYSYPAVMTVEERLAPHGIDVIFRPFTLGPIFVEQGMNDSPFKLFPARGRYMWRDLERICGALDLPFRPPSAFPRRSILPGKVAILGLEEGWGIDFTKRVYRAEFGDDADIGEEKVIRGILDGMGMDGLAIIARTEAHPQRAKLRLQTERARSLGIFGAPMFVVGNEIFWGQDRVDHAIAWSLGSR